MQKKRNINIAFHNYKIKCTHNQTLFFSSKMALLYYKITMN